MAQVQLPNNMKRILVITLLLVFISAVVVGIIGGSIKSINKEIKHLNNFIFQAKEIQPNFEQSLEMYTGQTKDIIEFLSELRPSSEEEVVKALSEIENIGQNLSLNVSLNSVGKDLSQKDSEKTLSYDIAFYGGITDLQNFLKELESLMYFIKVEQIEFNNTKYMDEKDLEREKNIKIKIILYTK